MEKNALLVKYGLAYVGQDGEVKFYERPSKIHEVNMLQADELNHTTFEKLEEYTYVLTAYLSYVQTEQNGRQYDLLLLKDEYETLLTRESYKLIGATKKEREAKAVEQSPKLQELKELYLRAEASLTLLSNIPEVTIEKLNFLKKVYDRRGRERQFGRPAA